MRNPIGWIIYAAFTTREIRVKGMLAMGGFVVICCIAEQYIHR